MDAKILLKKRQKILSYYDRFFNNEITISTISNIVVLPTDYCQKILMEKSLEEKEKKAKARLEKLNLEADSEKLEVKPIEDEIFKTETIEPLKVEELSNNKVRVTYPSKMNKT